MALAPRLDLRQSQSLVMTPQLQQAIKLLALSNLELEAVLAEELAKNPLLESANGEGEAAAPVKDERAVATDTLFDAGVGAASDTLDVDLSAETFHHDRDSDAIWDLRGSSGGADSEGFDFDRVEAADISLHDHLLAQAGETLSGPHHAMAVTLIGLIDEAGYIDVDMGELSLRLGVPRRALEDVLSVIQRFDPVGCGARSLSECLAAQAKEADRYDPCMAALIDNLDLVARGDLARLKRLCHVDDEDLADMLRELRGYDPKPGLRFGSEPAAPVTPDLFVHPTKDGWRIEINSATLPRLLVNRRYYAELATATGKGSDGKEGKAWLSDCLASANWLMKALDQRQQTIIKVAQQIVKQQEGFFLHGVSALVPLTLKQVADEIDMHESTVSRVTSNKYLACARGVFELKYFFRSGVATADGEGGMSAEAVKSRIAKLIEAESPDAILSDDTLVELLNKEGCAIARRTVAKYREAMGIGSSVQRRRAKAIGR
jgi:RNA polymerase sigma-54 factor